MRKVFSSQASKTGSYASPNQLCEQYSIHSERCKLVEGARCVHNGDQEKCSFYEQRQRKLGGFKYNWIEELRT